MTRARGHRDDDLPTEVRCPDCGKVQVKGDIFERGRPISAVCPECGERLYFADPEPFIFTHCNVCGRKLRDPEEDEMGMCEGCANL